MSLSRFSMTRRQALLGLTTALGLPLIARGARAAEDGPIKLRDLYNKDLTFSDLAKSLDGKPVTVIGYMAPPLKAESRFFVLTIRPMAVCPFCETSADWPDDILAIHTKRILEVQPYNVKILTRGTLALGDHKDPDTGFFSRVRLENASYERA